MFVHGISFAVGGILILTGPGNAFVTIQGCFADKYPPSHAALRAQIGHSLKTDSSTG
jgi:hypothetical protein